MLGEIRGLPGKDAFLQKASKRTQVSLRALLGRLLLKEAVDK